MSYGLDGRGSLPGRDTTFSLLHSVPTGFGAQPVCYSVDTGGAFFGIKRHGREADHSLQSNAEVKNGGVIPPAPAYVFVE
jgi:hypothetical protein